MNEMKMVGTLKYIGFSKDKSTVMNYNILYHEVIKNLIYILFTHFILQILQLIIMVYVITNELMI